MSRRASSGGLGAQRIDIPAGAYEVRSSRLRRRILLSRYWFMTRRDADEGLSRTRNQYGTLSERLEGTAIYSDPGEPASRRLVALRCRSGSRHLFDNGLELRDRMVQNAVLRI